MNSAESYLVNEAAVARNANDKEDRGYYVRYCRLADFGRCDRYGWWWDQGKGRVYWCRPVQRRVYNCTAVKGYPPKREKRKGKKERNNKIVDE